MSVTVSPEAYRTMIVFAASHCTKAVHGILVGSTSDDRFVVQNAFPICHETPTRPLVDIAEALVEAMLADDNNSNIIIGWFMSPEVLSDRSSGPVAMRVASVLPKNTENGVLLVLQNEEIGQLASNEKIMGAECMQGFGKDFGKQWTQALEVSILDQKSSTERTRKDIISGRKIEDLTDHWQNGVSTPWHPIVT
ncbi:unnamed protein product [Cylindrotheca closterium]|uniref:MPN domain-containing protein n=1 Tax=Cylindrotheca closterium TaxID=2856 RepID=A0AAD2D0C5_9STRA|nr:unnamed protein product [Cylindrotheca closterium]